MRTRERHVRIVPLPSEPATQRTIGILLVEDDRAVRLALGALIGTDPSLDLLGVSENADDAVTLARSLRPDVVIVDVKMRGGGPDAARRIRAETPSARLLAFSAYADRATVIDMLRAGAIGYLVKGTAPEAVLEAIHLTGEGVSSLSVEITGKVIEELVSTVTRAETLAAEVRELDRLKSEMIQILAHEISTPVTAILAFAAMVASGAELGPAEREDLAGSVRLSGERLRRLVTTIGATARLDRDGIETDLRPTKVADLFDAVTRGLASPRVRAIVDPELAEEEIWADLDLAVVAVTGVVENGLRFSRQDVPVELRAVRSGTEVEIRVTDHGTGIPEDVSRAIFEPFTQADSGSTRVHDGVGLGLYLARRVMETHGGGIHVDRHPEGGSVFTLAFRSVGAPG